MNFTPVTCDDFVIGLPVAGTLTEILNSDAEEFGGTGTPCKKRIKSKKEPFLEHKYSARITLPAMSAVWYRLTPTKTEVISNEA